MKHFLILLLAVLLVMTFVGCSTRPNSETPTIQTNPTTPTGHDESDVGRFSVDTKSLSLQSSMKNADGDTVNIYTDGKYRYFILEASNELITISLSDEAMEALGQKFADNPESLISSETAEMCLMDAVWLYFPEYDKSNLRYEVNETGNYIEYYAFIVYEYDGENRVNKASVSIAFDGTVSFVGGSHNSPELFNGSDVFSRDEILDTVFNYVYNEQDSIAKSVYSEDEYYDENGEIMPPYQLIVTGKDDLKDFSLEKIIYEGKPCWQAEFSLVSSWSQIDEFFEVTNPLFHFYVDAMTGEVISYIHT